MDKVFIDVDNQVVNGGHIKAIVETDEGLEIEVTGGDFSVNVTDPLEIDYVRLYMAAHEYFQIGGVHYNPAHAKRVQIGENNYGYVDDTDGDQHIHKPIEEVGQLLAAAPSFIWQPAPA